MTVPFVGSFVFHIATASVSNASTLLKTTSGALLSVPENSGMNEQSSSLRSVFPSLSSSLWLKQSSPRRLWLKKPGPLRKASHLPLFESDVAYALEFTPKSFPASHLNGSNGMKSIEPPVKKALSLKESISAPVVPFHDLANHGSTSAKSVSDSPR